MSILRRLLPTAPFLLSFLLATALAAQPIYKVKDRDGNVIYTDQKPSEDAEPIDLPELGVLDDDRETLSEALQETPAIDPAIEPLVLVIARPAEGAQLSTSAEGVAVELQSNVDLPPSAQIVLFIDDEPQEPIRQLSFSLVGLEPGNYRLHAELQTPSGRVLTRTEAISFGLRAPPEIIPAP